jgi:hypothetical protein
MLKQKCGISDKDILFMQKEMAKVYKMKDFKKMVFHAIADYGFKDYVDVQFNIIDPKHPNHKSTVTYKWLPKSRRGPSIPKK